MKYIDLQKKIVDEEGWLTKKALRFLVLRIALFTITLFLLIGLLTTATIGSTWAILLSILFLVIFITLIDLATDSQKSLKIVSGLTHLWMLNLALFVGLFILLRQYNFL